MIYRFKVWCWLPMTTEIHLTALSDEEAVQTFNKIDLSKGFDWKESGTHKSRVTYEIINVQNTDKGIGSSGTPGKKS